MPAASGRALQVELVPELGAKVTSIRLGSGREWLAPPLRPLTRPRAPDQDWADLDCSGWDECFPNVAPSRALDLLDHGDVWRRPWTVRPSDRGILTHISTERYRLARRLSVTGARLTAEYQLHNLGAGRLNWAWAQHPLLAIDTQTRLVLPAPAQVHVDSAFADGAPSGDVDWLCPAGWIAGETNLSAARGHAAKVWFERPHPALIGVRNGDEWLVWRLLDSSMRDVGLWVNLGGWGRHPLAHLAVEPAFGAADDPEAAYPRAAPADDWSLAGGQRRTWRVVIEAGRGDADLADLMALR
ncbi:MAG: hypothetical protein DLM57_05250 [Pseudonocardiales bacterium]|nr:MAG: hypothetical protein DLM57_05250 [Pseudonocardiales bacterium]